METKHTPGPWELRGTQTIIGADSTVVATVNRPMGGNRVQEEANARLIAAAPSLLAALQRLLHETDNGTQMCGENVAADARWAIDLATGKL